MIGRLTISTVILITTLTGVAFQGAQTPQHTLLVFKGLAPDGGPCPGCVAFDCAFVKNVTLRRNLQRHFQLEPAWSSWKHPEQFDRWNVTEWPTFIVVDSRGVERLRVVGFRPLTFWDEINPPRPAAPNSQQPDPNCVDGICAPPPKPTPDSESLRVQQINERLQQTIEETNNALQLLKGDLKFERQKAELERSQSAAERQQLTDELLQQSSAEPDNQPAEQERARPPDPDTSRKPSFRDVLPDISAEIPAAGGLIGSVIDKATEPGTLDKWATLGKEALKVGVTLAAPEVAIPGGVLLTAASVAGRFMWTRRKRKGLTIDGRSGLRTETKYVTRTVDYEAEQMREALRRVAGRHSQHPTNLALLREVEGVAKQLIHGQQVINEDLEQ